MSSDRASDSTDEIPKPVSEYADEAVVTQAVAREIKSTDFSDWYDEFQFRQNIRNGQEYFNGPSMKKPPGRFNPSDLLKCHRKTYYGHLNAPEETDDPDGIFFYGNRFEEDLAERYLEDSVDLPETYLQNSLWMNTTIDTDIGPITLVGSTDPVIVDEEGNPILLTEIKTTSSIEFTSEPKMHHLAQTHAYMYGLTEKYDRQIRDVVFLYADRDSLDAKTFHATFDREFWRDRVVRWMEENTFYRVFGFLPPADPEQDWECEYCNYKERCGQSSMYYENEEAAGLLPLYTEYPRGKVVEYLEAHEEAKLTPALAQTYPDLVDEYGAFPWVCNECDSKFVWDEINWNGGPSPECPNCDGKESAGRLRGPEPDEQHHIDVVDRPEGGSS